MERSGRNVLRASAVALFIGACGSSPTAPTLPASEPLTTPAPPPPVERRLSGFVRDGSSQPVADAKVLVYGIDRVPGVVTTDSNGFFETVTKIDSRLTVPWYEVTISKTGFDETSNGALYDTEDTTADFFLFRRLHLTAGRQEQVDQFPVTFKGPLCGFEQEFACRQVDVMASSDGILTIEATSDDPSVIAGVGSPTSGPPPPGRKSLLVDAGQTVTITVLVVSSSPWGPAQAFVPITLKTSVEPST
jgi:hypothetical protein